ncbi:MAG: hypothetical protein AAFP76_15340 [Bacteroidota bacterium]
MSPQFSLIRVKNSIFRDLILLKKGIFTALATTGVLFLIAFLYHLRSDQHLSAADFNSIFSKIYVTLGLLFTFSVFKEAQDQGANHLYFTLPLSPLERITSAWLTTTILYTLTFTFFAFMVAQLSILAGSVFPKTKMHALNIFTADYFSVVKLYFIIQPLFLFGAIAYRRNRIGKTLLLVLLILLGLAIFNFILCSTLNVGIYDSMVSEESFGADPFELAVNDFSTAGKWVFGIVMGPLMLLAAYFKLTEKEV